MKIVIAGGGSPSTPALFEYLAGLDELPALEFVLAGRNQDSLAGVVRAAELLLPTQPVSVRSAAIDTAEFERALDSADAVVLQIRAGGYAGRSFDESFPHRFGLCGDEGLGPGGLSAAWRAWPVFEPLLERIGRAAPKALLVILSSPVAILVRAGRLDGHRNAVGICELPWTTLRDVCTSLAVPAGSVDFDYIGTNHVGWFHRVEYAGRDLIREYAQSLVGSVLFPTAALVESEHAIPTKYLQLHYEPGVVLDEQRRRTRTRGEELSSLAITLRTVYRYGAHDQIRHALRVRPAPWYPYAVGPLLVSLAAGTNAGPFFLTTSPSGVAWIDRDDVLECACFTGEGALVGKPSARPVPAPIVDLLRQFVAYERVATKAVVSRDRRLLEEALDLHPWIPAGISAAIADEIVK